MDNQRDKRIEEIQQYVATSGRIDTGTKVFTYIEVDDASFLLSELSRLQVERDKAVEALIVERDDALTWDGIGTVNRINKVLSELGESHDPLD